jgi:DNA-directed RNA polymerase specialized sigma24 family protein
MNAATSVSPRLHLLARAAAAGDDHAMERLLQHAYVHVSRYYRSWLAGLPGGSALADELAGETLARIARNPLPPEGHAEADLFATWLTVARDLACEVVAG